MDQPTLYGLPVHYHSAVQRKTYILVHPDDRMELGRLVQDYDGMSLNEYQRLSSRTLPAESDIGPGSLSCLGMGIAGEAGEVADFLKKVVHHGHKDDAPKVFKELGDVLWYLQAIATRYGYTLEEVARGNVEKLKERYPEGFTSERSVNRKQEDE